MKKHFNKELVLTNEDIENFKSSRKCWICDNSFWWYFVEDDVRVIDHCQVNRKYTGAAHRDYNIKVSQHYKIAITFYNLKNYYAYPIMEELGKFDFKKKCHTKRIRKV